MVWIAFAYTPFGTAVLHGEAPPLEKSLSDDTPIAASKYLVDNPPQGLVFNSYEWGDYLLWAGPKDIQVFVASHAHWVPTEVWNDYLYISSGSADWDTMLDRYGVNTVAVDLPRRALLAEAVKAHDGWELRYQDNRSAVFVRKDPI